MIVKILITTLIYNICFIKAVLGASFSNVFVESQTLPARYYQYSAPYGYASIANPHYSKINTLPASLSAYVNPCVSPCVIPGQALTPVNPSRNILTYNSPYTTVPIIAEPAKEESTGYRYSYIIYDENTSDQKVQQKLDSGYSHDLEHGPEYSYNSEYINDSNNSNHSHELEHSRETEYKQEAVHEHEIKQSQASKNNNEHDYVPQNEPTHSQEHGVYQGFEPKIGYNDERIHKKDQQENQELYHVPNQIVSIYNQRETKEHSAEKRNKSCNESNIESEEYSQEKWGKYNDKKHKDCDEEPLDHGEKHEKTSKEKSIEVSKEDMLTKRSKENCEEESSGESKVELKEKSHKKSQKEPVEINEKHKKKSKEESKESSSESESEEIREKSLTHFKHKEVHELMLPEKKVTESYHDIIRCLHAALNKSYGLPSTLREEPSPLTYIVLNKPC